jgi:hypothetical protein
MDFRVKRWQTPRRPVRRAGPAVTVTVLAALGLLIAACSHGSSGPGVANGAPSSASPATSPSADPLAFARCMRDHGVRDFPDPDSSGNFNLSGGGDLNPTNPTYQAATQACRSLGSAGKGSEPALSPPQIAAIVEFARCMRDHQITNYPDPDSFGHIPGIRHFGIDPDGPQFQAAVDACEHYTRGIPGWPAQEGP